MGVNSWFNQTDDIMNRPQLTGDANSHGGSDTQGLLNTNKIVVHLGKRDRMHMVSTFLANALVKRVNRRMFILIVRFCRST